MAYPMEPMVYILDAVGGEMHVRAVPLYEAMSKTSTNQVTNGNAGHATAQAGQKSPCRVESPLRYEIAREHQKRLVRHW